MTTWTLLPVPEEDLADLAREVADRQRARGAATHPTLDDLHTDTLTTDTVRRVALGSHLPWPTEALTRLATGSTLTTQRWASVMDLCAARPGEFFSTSDIVNLTDLTLNEWRDACRKISAHLSKHYPDAPTWEAGPYRGTAQWPLVTISGRRLKVHDELHVAITAAQASRWLAVR